MSDQKVDREGSSMIKPLVYSTWVMAGLLLASSLLNYGNGDLWPGSIFTTLSAVAIIAAWYLHRRGQRNAKEI
jgi:hypothetical protein